VIIHISEQSLRTQSETIKNELLKHPHIFNVCGSNGTPIQGGLRSMGTINDVETKIVYYHVDYDYINTLKIEMKEGRFFSRDFPSDKTAVILNETAAQLQSLENPVGKQVEFGKKGTIIGIVKDFHIESLHKKISPLIMYLNPTGNKTLILRIHNENIPATLSYIEKTWNKFSPDRPLEYSFLDDKFNARYQSEEKLAKSIGVFAFISIMISCLGLLGLAAFTIERRTKEIGIRKVLGASIGGILSILFKESTKWVVISNLIAWPIAWYLMDRWLQTFAYQVNIKWWIFLLAGFVTMIVALSTISFQTIKAAIKNPVDSLKYE
jgi:putative ABC transport system permease protein